VHALVHAIDDTDILQLTGTIEKTSGAGNKQVLDKLKVERERGITGEL
jgi:translation elongation factor EF-4